MNPRSSLLIGIGLVLMLAAVLGGWWLASGHDGRSIVTPGSHPANRSVKNAPSIPPFTVQTSEPAKAKPGVPASPSAAKPKYEERDLPSAEDLAKFLNGEADSSLKK